MSPHAPYSADADLLTQLFANARAQAQPSTIHLAEDPAERDLLFSQTGDWADAISAMGIDPARRSPGMGPGPYLAECGAFDHDRVKDQPGPLLVHLTDAALEDIRLAARHQAPVVLCPRSNIYIGGPSAVPPVPEMLAHGVHLALGTDSLASNQDLNLWGEVQALTQQHPAVSCQTWLAAATSGGAYALRLPYLGGLKRGTAPGVNLLRPEENESSGSGARAVASRGPRPDPQDGVHTPPAERYLRRLCTGPTQVEALYSAGPPTQP